MPSQIVILDGYLVNPGDLSWSPISDLGQLIIYDHTPEDLVVTRSLNADVLLVNKVKLASQHFKQLPRLKLICLLATGYDNVDVEAARQFGVTVCNATDYSTDSVAQHVFAMILTCTNKVQLHNHSVKSGDWSRNSWSYSIGSIRGLKGKVMGVYGGGKIGMRVAALASAFGMKILVYKRTMPKAGIHPYHFVQPSQLFEESDILTFHVPLTGETLGIINQQTLSMMKPDALLVNTSRGGLVNEKDLSMHLLKHPEFTAALDVLSVEPPPASHPLIDQENCIITPHNAWSNIDARTKLIRICAENIRLYCSGDPQNVIA